MRNSCNFNIMNYLKICETGVLVIIHQFQDFDFLSFILESHE